MKTTLLFLLSFAITAGSVLAEIDWDSASSVQTGIKLVKLEWEKPRLMKICVMRVDLTTPGLGVTATERSPEWGKPMPDYTNSVLSICTRREKTASFMTRLRHARKLNMIAAVNAAPWIPWCSPWNHKYANPTGVQISDGIVISENWRDYMPMLVFYKTPSSNGGTKAKIITSLTKEEVKDVDVASTGFAILMKNGKIVDAGAYEKELHPRTAIGLSKDERFLYIVTVDGRQKDWSLGANGADLCAIMYEAGAYNAINMDGGGSTTLCYWSKDENKPVVTSRHAGNAQRTVAFNIGFYIEADTF